MGGGDLHWWSTGTGNGLWLVSHSKYAFNLPVHTHLYNYDCAFYDCIFTCMTIGNQSLENLRHMYFGMKDTVFKRQSKFISHICDTNALEELIKGVLGTEKRMGHVTKPK